MREKIENYIRGMEEQKENAERQAIMLEGALQFARQLLEDLDSDEEE